MNDSLSSLRAGELRGQTRLDLRFGLEEFPREIFQLSETLEILNLSGNRLSELPGDLPRLQKLKILFCSENDFEVLPEVLGRCPSLEMVGFKSNRIGTVPDGAFPPNLRWLILTDNRIERLPATLGQCARLQKLMLAGNRLDRLPDELRHCVNLELIRLSANQFESFPGWLFEMPRLAWLGLGGNPWAGLPVTTALPEIPWHWLEPGEILGEGASGVIHRAALSTEKSDLPVAVKLFKGAMTSDGTPETEMAICMAAGSHPGLTGVIGRLSDHPEGTSGLVMPLLDPLCRNLAGPPDLETCTRDVYREGLTFTPQEAHRIISDLASVGHHLHEKRIMHGDFYAHNILRHPGGASILGDFGAACVYPPGAELEKIEVRAFGCLLEELLDRTEDALAGSSVVQSLSDIKNLCLSDDVKSRPVFTDVQKLLGNITVHSGF